MSGSTRETAKRAPNPVVLLAVGTIVLGACNYLYLALVGNVVGGVASAPVSVLWTMMAGIAVGLFQPIEQMLSRGIARARSAGHSALPIIRRTLLFAAVLLGATVVALSVLFRPVARLLFSGDGVFVVLFAIGLVSSTALFFIRGALAGTGAFGRYAVELAAEGVLKIAGVSALAAAGTTDPRLLGIPLVVAPLVAAALSLVGLRRPGAAAHGGAVASRRVDLAAFAALTTGSLLLQLFVNIGVLLAQAAVAGETTTYTASLVAALAIARVPLFLFNAVQSLMLTRFTVDVQQRRFRYLVGAVAAWCGAVLALGVVWVVLVALFGRLVLSWFGRDFSIDAGELTLLAVSCVLQIVTMVVTQGLLALHRERLATLVWPVGLVALVVTYALPWPSLGVAIASAMVVGTAVTVVVSGLCFGLGVRSTARTAPVTDDMPLAPELEQP